MDPIQDSDLGRRNADERALILGARDNPAETIMPDGRTVAQFQAETYEQHLAEARADEAVQQQRIREQSIKDDPIYAKEVVNAPQSVAVTETVVEKPLAQMSKAELVAEAERLKITVVPDRMNRDAIIGAIQNAGKTQGDVV